MMRTLHELRRHEEGQALVLAAISMLILSLCVLATVNLSYAASQRIKLQNAADAAAYTTAAYQARALNFFAYTNRAQVVQYASQMTMMGLVSYLIFAYLVASAFATALAAVPVIGWIFNAIKFIIKIQLVAAEIYCVMGVFALDALNIGAGLAQFAVYSAMLAKVVNGPTAEIQAHDRRYQVSSIASSILRVDSAYRWARTVATSPLPRFQAPAQREEKLNRAIMTELANSARGEWTAYGGDAPGNISYTVGIPRRLYVNLSFVGFRLFFGKVARTEWGALNVGTGGGIWGWLGSLTGGFTNVNERIYSDDALLFKLKIPLIPGELKFELPVQAWADRRLGGHDFQPKLDICDGVPRWLRGACRSALSPIMSAINAGLGVAIAAVADIKPGRHHWHFGQAQYARYRPAPDGQPKAVQWFNQPPVLLMVTLPKAGFDAPAGRKLPFLGTFGARLGTLSSATSKLSDGPGQTSYVRQNRPKRGFRPGTDMSLHGEALIPGDVEGLHAISAAIAYYHRPGDWREPPNTFNPFWGAKLMPVADYPTLQSNGFFRRIVNAGLLVH